MTPKKLYTIAGIVALSSIVWIVSKELYTTSLLQCPFKAVTSVPCPACGTTSAVVHILHGRLIDAFLLNPLSYLALPMIIIVPLWIIADIVTCKDTFFAFYRKAESLLLKRKVYLTAIAIILLIWLNNIYRSL